MAVTQMSLRLTPLHDMMSDRHLWQSEPGWPVGTTGAVHMALYDQN